MHSGGKSNKCNQCDSAFFYASALRTHLKTHSGEKSNKCNQCDYASSEVGDLRKHLKTHSGEEPNRCGVTLPALTQVLWGDTRRSTNQFRKEKTVYLSSWVDPQRTRIKVKINLASYNSNLWNKYQQLHFWKEKHILFQWGIKNFTRSVFETPPPPSNSHNHSHSLNMVGMGPSHNPTTLQEYCIFPPDVSLLHC